MKTTRRSFLGRVAGAGALSVFSVDTASAQDKEVTDEALRRAAARPVLESFSPTCSITAAWSGPCA